MSGYFDHIEGDPLVIASISGGSNPAAARARLTTEVSDEPPANVNSRSYSAAAATDLPRLITQAPPGSRRMDVIRILAEK